MRCPKCNTLIFDDLAQCNNCRKKISLSFQGTVFSTQLLVGAKIARLPAASDASALLSDFQKDIHVADSTRSSREELLPPPASKPVDLTFSLDQDLSESKSFSESLFPKKATTSDADLSSVFSSLESSDAVEVVPVSELKGDDQRMFGSPLELDSEVAADSSGPVLEEAAMLDLSAFALSPETEAETSSSEIQMPSFDSSEISEDDLQLGFSDLDPNFFEDLKSSLGDLEVSKSADEPEAAQDIDELLATLNNGLMKR